MNIRELCAKNDEEEIKNFLLNNNDVKRYSRVLANTENENVKKFIYENLNIVPENDLNNTIKKCCENNTFRNNLGCLMTYNRNIIEHFFRLKDKFSSIIDYIVLNVGLNRASVEENGHERLRWILSRGNSIEIFRVLAPINNGNIKINYFSQQKLERLRLYSYKSKIIRDEVNKILRTISDPILSFMRKNRLR